MAQKRFSWRRRRRYLIEWTEMDSVCTGFTQDISSTGIFIRSTYIPKVGAELVMKILVPGRPKLRLRGRVVRSLHVPQNLRAVVPSGFAIRLTEAPEEYFQLLASLFRLTFAKTG